MRSSIDKNDVGLDPWQASADVVDEHGLGNPVTACRAPRPGEGRGSDTPSRLIHGWWFCL